MENNVENNMQSKKDESKKWKIIGIILVVTILASGYYIAAHTNLIFKDKEDEKNLDTKEEQTNNSNSGSNVASQTDKTFAEQCKENSKDNCIMNFTINSEKVTVTLIAEKMENYSGYTYTSLNINGKTFEPENRFIQNVIVFNDLLFIESEGMLPTPQYEIIDTNGKLVFSTVKDLEMPIFPQIIDNNSYYKIKNNKISFGTSWRGTPGGGMCDFYYKNYSEVNKDNYELLKNEIADAIYEIEYLGNGKFSSPKMTSSTLVKDSDLTDCKEY